MRFGEFEIKLPEPKLRNPHCLAFLSPWINSGNVAKHSFNRLSAAANAQKIGELVEPGKFYDFTRYRPKLKDVDGKREFKIPNSIIAIARTANDNNPDSSDIVLLNMLEPHNLGETFNQSVISVLQGLNIQRYMLLGSMYNMVPHTRPLPVSAKSFNLDIPEVLLAGGARPPQYEGATSIVSVITETLANTLDMQTMSLIVNLPVYSRVEDNYMGVARLMGLLAHIYEWLEVDQNDERKSEAVLAKIEASVQSDNALTNLVKQLEKTYDKNNSATSKTSDTELSPEIQRFLSNITQSLEKTEED